MTRKSLKICPEIRTGEVSKHDKNVNNNAQKSYSKDDSIFDVKPPSKTLIFRKSNTDV